MGSRGDIGAGPGELEGLAETAIGGLRRAFGRAARMAAALRLHTVLVGVLRGKSAVDLALAETLVAIGDADGALSLPGRLASVQDFAREKLGWARSTTDARMHVARALRRWPKVREAVRTGELTLRKAQTVLPAVDRLGEDAAVGLGKMLTLAHLEARVKALGCDAWVDEAYEQAVLQMSEAQRRRYERGLEWARYAGVGLGTSRTTRTAYLAMEFLGSHPHASDEARAALEKVDRLAGRATYDAGFWSSAWSTLSDLKDVAPQAAAAVEAAWLRTVGRAFEAANDDGGSLPAETVPASLPGAEAWALLRDLDPPTGARVGELGTHALRLHALREAWDHVFGRLVWAVHHHRAWALLGAPTWESYCLDGLGLTPQGVRKHVRLEEKMNELPALRRAVRAGRLTFTQACAVGRVATPATVDSVIEDAVRHTVQDLEKKEEDEADRNLRSRGEVRICGRADDLETIRAGIYAMQLLCLRTGVGWVSPGEALARLADHFFETWKELVNEPSRKDRELVARTDGLCMVPGCSRGMAQRHHVIFRSHGGRHGPENLVPLCGAHHLRALHQGWITIRGRAGERILIVLHAARPGDTPETWIVEGEERAVRVARAAGGEARGAGDERAGRRQQAERREAQRAGDRAAGRTPQAGRGEARAPADAAEAAWAEAARALVDRAQALGAQGAA